MFKYSSIFFSVCKVDEITFPQFNDYPSLISKHSLIRKKTNNFRNNKLECHNRLVNDIKRGQLVKNSTKQTAKLVRQALTSHFRASVVISLPKMWVFASAAKSSITRLRKLGQLSRGWGYRGHSKPHKSCSTCTCNCIA